MKNRFATYLLILVSMVVFTIVILMMAEAMPRSGQQFLWLFSWVPMVGMFMTEFSAFDDDVVAAVNTVVTLIYSLILFGFAVRAFKLVREAERTCLDGLEVTESERSPEP